MLLYYCTVCSLYPSLFSRGLPSSFSSIAIETEEDLNNENLSETNGAELETTSEGLCDHVKPSLFNIYLDHKILILKFKYFRRNC